MEPKPVLIGILIVLSISGKDVRAQSAGAARTIAMGGISVALDGFWSVAHNQAGMTTSSQPAIGISGSNPYFISSLHDFLLGVIFPAGKNAFGITLQQRGNANFREQYAGLAYARTFGTRIRAGLRFDYVHLSISEGYGRSNGITFDAGVQIILAPTIVMGIQIYNPVGVKLTPDENEKPPGRILFGFAFRLTEPFLVAVELEKDLDFRLAIKTGMEYKLTPAIAVRIGYKTLPSPSGMDGMPVSSMLSFGCGMQIGAFYFDVAGSIHASLGWTPTASLIYKLGTNFKQAES